MSSIAEMTARVEELKQQFEKRYEEITGQWDVYTQDANFNYIEDEVQMAWKMYLRGHEDAYHHIEKLS